MCSAAAPSRGGERIHRRRGAARADDRAILEQRACVAAQRVEASGDEALQRRRHSAGFEIREGIGLRGGRLAQDRGELLDEERVAAGALVQRGGEPETDVVAEQRRRERVHRLLVERVDADDGEVAAAGVDARVGPRVWE